MASLVIKNQDIFALALKLSSNMQKLRELIKKWGSLVLLPTVVTLCVILLAIFFILASSKRTSQGASLPIVGAHVHIQMC